MRVSVTVSPNAPRSEVIARRGDGWKVRVAAAPEHGRANAALVEILAGVLGLPRDRIRIAAGRTSRRKVIEIDGLDEEEIGRRLEAAARMS